MAIDALAGLLIQADALEFRRASAWLESLCTERAVPAAQVQRLDLCLNEALANVLSHGGAGALTNPIELAADFAITAHGGSARVTVSDAGVPFDPLAVGPQARPRTLDEAQPGGLGLLMIRSFSDHMSYHLEDGRNHLSFTVTWNASQ